MLKIAERKFLLLFLFQDTKSISLIIQKFGLEGIRFLIFLNKVMCHYHTHIIPLSFIKDKRNPFDTKFTEDVLNFLCTHRIYKKTYDYIYPVTQNKILRFNEPRKGDLIAAARVKFDPSLISVPTEQEIKEQLSEYAAQCKEEKGNIIFIDVALHGRHKCHKNKLFYLEWLWFMVSKSEHHVASIFYVLSFCYATKMSLEVFMHELSKSENMKIDKERGIIYDTRLRRKDNLPDVPDDEELYELFKEGMTAKNFFNTEK